MDENGSAVLTFWEAAAPNCASIAMKDLFFCETVKVVLPGAKKDLLNWEFASAEFEPGASINVGPRPVVFLIEYDLEFWAQPYSIADLATCIETVLDEHPEFELEYWQRDENTCIEGFGVSTIVTLNTTIKEIADSSPSLVRLTELIREELDKYINRGSLVVGFEFPFPIKSACEQYLMYFIQFLRDLGIEANAQLKGEATKVLFTVTPREHTEALERIREALDLYLRIPTVPEFGLATKGFTDAAVSQLQANVLHLQSQVLLAKALLEAKEAALCARNDQILALQERLDLRRFLPAAPSDTKQPSDSEPILKGIIAVKKYDYKFLQIDFPEILRRLKRVR